MKLPFEGYLRRKDPREAADAGLLFWRENFACFLLFFAIPFWICAFALRLLPGETKYFSWLILWLLKPLFDRSILHIISVRFFEPGANLGRLCKGLGKNLRTGLLGDLLWRRFSPYRCAVMPIRVLEQSKKNFEDRRRVLMQNGLGFGLPLTIWGVFLEIVLLYGGIMFIWTGSRIFGYEIFSFSRSFFLSAEIFIFAAWCLNYMLVETLYVCKGFSLYINSRIEVDGWDIEVLFRGFAKKHKSKKAVSNMQGVFVLCLLFFLPPVIHADNQQSLSTNNSPSAADKIPFEVLQEIFASPDFGGERETWSIRFRDRNRTFPEININPLAGQMRTIFAFLLRLIIAALVIMFVLYIYLYAKKFINKQKYKTNKTYAAILHGMPAKDPQTLLQMSKNFYEQGNLRMAWGYCTAAAILSCSYYRGFNFPPNATENDCANMILSAKQQSVFNQDEIQSFCSLINNWINFAYAGRTPQDDSFAECLNFCSRLGKNG